MKPLILALAFTLTTTGANAQRGPAASGSQSTGSAPKNWEFVITPYFIAAGMDGNIQVAETVVPVDVSFSSVLENLQLGGMLHVEAQKQRLAIFGDFIFMALGSRGPSNNVTTTIDIDEYIGEFGFAYRFGEPGKSFSVLAGARYFEVKSVIQVGNLFSSTRGFDFVDPLFGARFNWAISDKVSLLGRADLAGFGLGSKLTVNAEAMVGYRMNDRTTVFLGYRVIAIEYEQGSSQDLFVYDVTTGGILMGAAIRF